MILTNELNTLDSINEAWLRESLELAANTINTITYTHMDIYNNNPNHFTIVVAGTFEYMLDTTEYTAELTHQDKTLLVAVADDSDDFENRLAVNVINAIYKTL